MGDYGGLLIFALPLLLLWFAFSRTRRQQRALAELQAALTVGDQVMTTSGLYGRVTGVESAIVQLEVAPGVVTRWARQAIARVELPGDDSGSESIDLEHLNQPDPQPNAAPPGDDRDRHRPT